MQGLRSEYDVDKRRPPVDALTFLAGDTAADADHQFGPFLLPRPPAAEFGKDLFLRFLPDRTGIDQQQIRVLGIFRQRIPMRFPQHVRHLVRVVLVHLAAHGLDEKFFRHRVPVFAGFRRGCRRRSRRSRPRVAVLRAVANHTWRARRRRYVHRASAFHRQ